MNIFDDLRPRILADFSDWFTVNDPNSSWSISSFSFAQGVDENLTHPHCWKCVTVNNCWFKNEKNKKPLEFDYSSVPHFTLLKKGLYHPNCHCKKLPIKTPLPENISFDFLAGKIKYFFMKKLEWFFSWGYHESDAEYFVNLIQSLVKVAYVKGNYEIEKHTKYGFAINVFISIPGKNEKHGRCYDVWSCYTVFPNGKLKLNTIVGGHQ